MSDNYADGTPSLFTVLQPRGAGWREIPGAAKLSMYPARAFFHDRTNLAVISAVEVASDEDKGPEYHLSISKQLIGGPSRCTSDEARWVLDQFGLDGAEEDNHVPSGKVRNFWRPLATGLIGKECVCKADEPAIVEDKGDFVWRAALPPKDSG